MQVSQKCRYAVRAVFELARRYEAGPTKISAIAAAQAIPTRFLEVILNQLKHSGFLRSQRGADGGYMLVRPPAEVSVGEVMRLIQGPVMVVDCDSSTCSERCPLYGDCVFLSMWKRAERAVTEVYDSTSFQDLLNAENAGPEPYEPVYEI